MATVPPDDLDDQYLPWQFLILFDLMRFKMKRLNKTIIAGALITAVFAPAAFAADGTITFNGTITGQTCTISGEGGNTNFTVTLPTVSASALGTAGSTAGRTPFRIALTGCDPTTGNVAAYFEPGATVDRTTGRLVNTAATTETSTPARNVQIGVLNSSLGEIALGSAFSSQNSPSVALASGAATLDYYAQYVAMGTGATAGPFTTTTTYSIVYP